MRDPSAFPELLHPGYQIGLLTLVELVRNLQGHKLYATTPVSYMKQGRVWECKCQCGNSVLYSENALTSGRLKSCGCVKKGKSQKAFDLREEATQRKVKARTIRLRIFELQQKLKSIQSLPGYLRNIPEYNLEVQAISDELRSLFAQKGYVNLRIKPQKQFL